MIVGVFKKRLFSIPQSKTFFRSSFVNVYIYTFNKTRHLNYHVPNSRPNSWTEWAEHFSGHSWVAWGWHRLNKYNVIFIFFPRPTPGPSASIYIYNYICKCNYNLLFLSLITLEQDTSASIHIYITIYVNVIVIYYFYL